MGHLIRVPDTDDIRDRSFITSQGERAEGGGSEKCGISKLNRPKNNYR